MIIQLSTEDEDTQLFKTTGKPAQHSKVLTKVRYMISYKQP